MPARHYGGRYMVDTFFRPANGYVIERDNIAIYFAGDTAYFKTFRKIGSRFKLDLALLPIGAYRPAWMMKASHMNPAQTVRSFFDLKADAMIPIHWGTFKLSLEPLDEPLKLLNQLSLQNGLEKRIKVLQPGQSYQP